MAGPAETVTEKAAEGAATGWGQGAGDAAAAQGTSLVSWMAWTPETAYFFSFIALCLLAMTVWEVAIPGGDPRRGILGLDTTRGDRLFISLLGSAFIHLAWLALVGSNLWPAVGISLLYALAVFLWV